MIAKTTFAKNKTKTKQNENSAAATTTTKTEEKAMWFPVFKEPPLSITKPLASDLGCVETSSIFCSWLPLNKSNLFL